MNDSPVSQVGAAIKSARLAARLSLRELAEKAGIDHASIFNIESGKTQEISFSKVGAISKALGLSLDELVSMRYVTCDKCDGLGFVRVSEEK